MRISCPLCSTTIKAGEEHIGLKNRCATCGTKFLIPSSEDAEIKILERGELPSSTAPKIQVNPPGTSPLLKPRKHRPLVNPDSEEKLRSPRKLITSSDPLRASTSASGGKAFRALPSVPPPENEKTEPGSLLRKNFPHGKAARNKASRKHSLEHQSALDPDPQEKAHQGNSSPSDTTRSELSSNPSQPEITENIPSNVEPEDSPSASPVEEDNPLVTESGAISTSSTEPSPEPSNKGSHNSREEEQECKEAGRSLPAGTFPIPAPVGRRHGSFHDLKVKRTQKDSKGLVQACIVLSICAVVGLIAFSGMNEGEGEVDSSGNALVPAGSPNPISDTGIVPSDKQPGITAGKSPETAVHGNQWSNRILPWIEHYCLDCHDEANEEGGLELERFTSEKLALSEPHTWEKAAQLVEMGDMPPRDRFNLPSNEERAQFVNWVRSVSNRWDAGEFGKDPGRTTIRRMTKNEYNYTMRDLFGLKIRPADNFPEDGGGEDGFDNNADALFLPPLLMENYVEAAGLLVNEIYRNQESFRRWLFAFPHNEGGDAAAARKILNHWLPLLYRRPVDSQEVESLVSVMRFQMDKKKKPYREAMKMPLLAMLISPHFLYRSEAIQDEGKAYPVGDVDLASRLSYFLWSSTPDQQLLQLAFKGKLSDPQVYREQVLRMLVDDKARALGMHFAGQWLKWEDLRSRANPDRKRFPNFDFALRVSMYRESSLFFDNLVRENLPILDLIDSDYSFLNQKLAIHYDIPGISHSSFQKVALDDPNRGGVIGMGSVLTATSLPLRSSPAKRGNYLLTDLLGTPPPAPPMDVPQLPEDDEEIEFKSFRDALTEHRENPSCKSCHEAIDPMGFGMENYDAVGRWRQFQNDQPIDSSGKLPSGESFSNPSELKALLMKRKDTFTRNMAEKALAYALGRELTAYDRQVSKSITDKVIADGYRAQTLFLEVARSYPFLNCRDDDFRKN